MTLLFRNVEAEKLMNDCQQELEDIKKIIKKLSSFDAQVPFLTRYAVIRSSGSLEMAYKSMICDSCETGANRQMKKFLEKNFREKPVNLKYDMICKSLTSFDEAWNKNFKLRLRAVKKGDSWKTSLDSLMELRNSFAHGGKPTASFADVFEYFKHSRRILILVDRIVI